MKFKFGFETLLRHRKNLERAAQREYAEAKQRADQCLAEINRLYKSIDDCRLQIADWQAKEQKANPKILQTEEYIAGTKKMIERLRLKARELLQVADDKRDILIEAMKEYKVLERLKEKRSDEFRKQKRKWEEKQNNELSTMRFKRGQRP